VPNADACSSLLRSNKIDIIGGIQWGRLAGYNWGRSPAEMADDLKLATLHRTGSVNPMKRERHTFDFVVNGVSLFKVTGASSFDMCGCFSDPRFERELASRCNYRIAAMLTSDVPVGGGHRVALFVCSECGDLACGAVTVRVSRNDLGIQWSDFEYENGYEAGSELDDVGGPFEFEWGAYLMEIRRAHAK
jgi:hypothetical protein